MKLQDIIKFIKFNVTLNALEKKYIKKNQSKWPYNQEKKKSIILVDLFSWYPYIHFWSYLTNIISKKKNSQIKYFYFDLNYKRKFKSRIYILKLIKIFKSFNCTEGISDYSFTTTNKEIKNYRNKFFKLKKNKTNLINFKRKNIKIGDLIYDTYLLLFKKPTVDFDDNRLLELFIRGNKLFDECFKYINNNKIDCIIPSHVCYSSYGIISRIALNKNIPIFKIKSENWGKALFRLIKIDKNACVDEHPYYDYRKIFSKFSKLDKIKFRKIGKKLIEQRLSGNKDKNLPYMKVSSYNKLKDKKHLDDLKSNKSVIIFSHSLNDNPHRFRNMIFPDFYEQTKFLLKISNKFKNYSWLYKPHPNESFEMLKYHEKMLSENKNVIMLNQNFSNSKILNLKPALAITNHGTIGHEFAYSNVPVINTGDNPHVSYNFCLNPRNKKELKENILRVLQGTLKKNIIKDEIREFMFMHYEYFPNLYNRKKYLDDRFFSYTTYKVTDYSKPLNLYIKENKKIQKQISMYINSFLDFELK